MSLCDRCNKIHTRYSQGCGMTFSKPKLTAETLLPSSRMYDIMQPSILDIAKFLSKYKFMTFRKHEGSLNHTYEFTTFEYLTILKEPKDKWILDSLTYPEFPGNERLRALYVRYEWIEKRMLTTNPLCTDSMFVHFDEDLLTWCIRVDLMRMIGWLHWGVAA